MQRRDLCFVKFLQPIASAQPAFTAQQFGGNFLGLRRCDACGDEPGGRLRLRGGLALRLRRAMLDRAACRVAIIFRFIIACNAYDSRDRVAFQIGKGAARSLQVKACRFDAKFAEVEPLPAQVLDADRVEVISATEGVDDRADRFCREGFQF